MPEPADLVLEQLAQRLDRARRRMSSGSPPTLWWLLITAAVPSAPPDSMRSGYSVPWTRNSASTSPPVCSSKTRMNSSPIALRLASGSVTPARRAKKRSPASTWISSMPIVAAERLGDLLALALAHQPGVDVDARQLVADRPVHERRGDRRVDAAGQRADRPAVADLGADAGDLLVDDRRHRPRRRAARPARGGTGAARPCRTASGRPRGGTARRRSAGRRPRARRPGRRRSTAVAVNPAGASVMASKWLIQTSWTSGASSGSSSDGAGAAQLGPAVLAAHAPADGAAELLGDELGAVADAEDRDAEVVDRRVERRGAVDVDALRVRPTGSAPPAARSATSAAVMRLGTISEYTASSRTRRAMSWAYWAPKSTTSTACSCSGSGVGRSATSVQGLDRRRALVETCSMRHGALGRAARGRSPCSPSSLVLGRAAPAAPRPPAPTAPTPPAPPSTTGRRQRRSSPSRDLDDCISALPSPDCGSEARGGWRQALVFGVARRRRCAFIAWRIVRSAPQSRPDRTHDR